MKIVQHPTQPWCRWECEKCERKGVWLLDRALVVRNSNLHVEYHDAHR